MEEALKAYAAAANYGVADVTTAATYHTASLYQDFGKAMLTSQRPKKLSKAELEQYNVMLEEQAFPFEEKAMELHEVNAKRAAAGIYDKWVQEKLQVAGRVAAGSLRQIGTRWKRDRCDSLTSSTLLRGLPVLAAALSAAHRCPTRWLGKRRAAPSRRSHARRGGAGRARRGCARRPHAAVAKPEPNPIDPRAQRAFDTARQGALRAGRNDDAERQLKALARRIRNSAACTPTWA